MFLVPFLWREVSKQMRIRKVVREKEVRIISPERKDKVVKTRNESRKPNFMTPSQNSQQEVIAVLATYLIGIPDLRCPGI